MTVSMTTIKIPYMAIEPIGHVEGGHMGEFRSEEWFYEELRRRAVAMFGEERADALEDYLRTAAHQAADVEEAEVHRDLEPLVQG